MRLSVDSLVDSAANAWDLMVRRTLPDHTTEDTRYDANHNPIARVVREAGRERVQTRSYDRLGRLLTVSRPARDGHEVVVSHEYDGNGNRVATRRGDHVVTVAYDALDRPWRRTRGEPEKGHRDVTFDYDAKGGQRRVQVVGDRAITRLVKTLRTRRGGGHELLAYRDGDGWRDNCSPNT